MNETTCDENYLGALSRNRLVIFYCVAYLLFICTTCLFEHLLEHDQMIAHDAVKLLSQWFTPRFLQVVCPPLLVNKPCCFFVRCAEKSRNQSCTLELRLPSPKAHILTKYCANS